MNRFAVIALSAALALSVGTYAIYKTAHNEDSPASQKQMIGMPNPFTTHKTLQDAELHAGITMRAPDTIDGKTPASYSTLNEGGFIDVSYGEGEDEIILRKAMMNNTIGADISGDYNTYAETSTVTVDGVILTLKGNDGTVSNVTWTQGDYAFSIMSRTGKSQALMLDVAAQMMAD